MDEGRESRALNSVEGDKGVEGMEESVKRRDKYRQMGGRSNMSS